MQASRGCAGGGKMLGTARISRGPRHRTWPRGRLLPRSPRIPCRDPPLPGAQSEERFTLAAESTGISTLAERYAAALFELADERHALDAVAGDMRELRAMLQASPDLVRLMRSPVVSRDEQKKAVAALAQAAGLSDLTRDFLGVVAANRRLFPVA